MTRKIDLSSVCILAIDFQDEYRAEGAWPVAGYGAIRARARVGIPAARRVGMAVVHLHAWSVADDPCGKLARESTPDALRFCVADSPGAAIAAEVAPAAGEVIMPRPFPAAFAGPILPRRCAGAA
jgi:nicotinamidase-related amidase